MFITLWKKTNFNKLMIIFKRGLIYSKEYSPEYLCDDRSKFWARRKVKRKNKSFIIEGK